jgi:hypothetical protein
VGNIKRIYVEDGDTLEICVQKAGTPKNKKAWEDSKYLGRSAISITFKSAGEITLPLMPRPKISLERLGGVVSEELCCKA